MSDVLPPPPPTATQRLAARELAARLLATPWRLGEIAASVADALPRVPPWPRAALIEGLHALGAPGYPPSPAVIVALLLAAPSFGSASGGIVLEPPLFAPLPAFAGLPIPALTTVGALAEWLLLSVDELAWFAGERPILEPGPPKLINYRYLLLPKRDGSLRLVEAPKARLKAIQRRVLDEILSHVRVHDEAHGFVSGRSCLTAARRHAGEAVVATFDLAQFFPSLGAPRIHGLFRALGYPWAVARALTGLCTTVTPVAIVERMARDPAERAELLSIYGARHLPQGAPSSPALANLLAWRLDRRLHGLADAAGATYTRYADDLAFSGDRAFARGLPGFALTVAAIAAEEGFRLQPTKTRIMRAHQRQSVTGVVVNAHLNVDRAAFDRLKAILHHCAKGDPAAQNRAGVPDFRRHLEGRIAWVAQVNPARGARLWQVFDRIDWGDAEPGPQADDKAACSLDTPTPRS